jgi:hypothetical protein
MSAVDNAKLLGENFAAWIKEKHPEFIEKNKTWKGMFMAPGMVKLFNEFSKEMNEAAKK